MEILINYFRGRTVFIEICIVRDELCRAFYNYNGIQFLLEITISIFSRLQRGHCKVSWTFYLQWKISLQCFLNKLTSLPQLYWNPRQIEVTLLNIIWVSNIKAQVSSCQPLLCSSTFYSWFYHCIWGMLVPSPLLLGFTFGSRTSSQWNAIYLISIAIVNPLHPLFS